MQILNSENTQRQKRFVVDANTTAFIAGIFERVLLRCQRYIVEIHIEILVDALLGPSISSTSASALNKIKRLYNHVSDHIVMIVTRKDSVWKRLLLLYELYFNVRNTVMSNTSKKLMLQNGNPQFKKKVF